MGNSAWVPGRRPWVGPRQTFMYTQPSFSVQCGIRIRPSTIPYGKTTRTQPCKRCVYTCVSQSGREKQNIPVMRYVRYATIVSRSFGVEPTTFVLPGVLLAAGLVLVAGVSGLLMALSVGFGLVLSFMALISVGWLFLPFLFLFGATATFAVLPLMAGGLLLAPLAVLAAVASGGYVLGRMLLSNNIMSEKAIGEALESIEDDTERLELEELELKMFDERLKRRRGG